MSNKLIPELGNSGSNTVVASESQAADVIVKTDSDGDIAVRRIYCPAASGGIDNLGYLKGGVVDASTSQTIDEANVNGVLYNFTTGSSSLVATLPSAAASVGRIIAISKVDSGTGIVTVTRAGSDTFAGQSTFVLRKQYETIVLMGLTSTTFAVLAYFPSPGTAGPGSLSTLVPDPGSSGAIPISKTGYVPLVSGGAETRTLAAPGAIGTELLIYFKTSGGNVVVTCSTTFNETGNNTITFSATGQAVRMVAVEEGSNLRWRCTTADGASLSTV